MEALAALGVAAAVVQFVDFAYRTCKTVQRVLDDGAPAMLNQVSFEGVVRDFQAYMESLEGQKRFTRDSDELLAANNEAIDHIVDSCRPLVNRLIVLFVELGHIFKTHSEPEEKSSKIRRVKNMGPLGKMRATWRNAEIDDLLVHLNQLQSQLIVRMLHHLNVVTNESRSSQQDGFAALSKNHSEIIEVLTLSEKRMDSVLKEQTQGLRLALDQSEMRALARDEKVIAAILTLKDGATKLVKTNEAIEDRSEDAMHRSVMTLRASSSASTSTRVENFSEVHERILNCLFFRQILDRVETVGAAHTRTYDWVFKDHVDAEQPETSFINWLRNGSGCFMVSGKAGSGKSTLMKYIFEDSRTRAALRQWAGQGQLVAASFFFWNLGTEMQKSQKGLLRSLLYTILSRRPYLMSALMPELLKSVMHMSGSEPLQEPSFAELLRWFRKLLEQMSSEFRLFLSIDGLDEYDGDTQELVDLIIKSASDNPNVKFLSSSRPIPASVDSFSSAPTIQLHDLTRPDMKKFVEDHLREGFTRKHSKQWSQLVEEIIEKSCGVFLWVALVSRSLKTGLRNHDNIQELRDRLDELPSDLKDLYAHMLHKVPLSYRRQASELFQILILATSVQTSDTQLSPIQVYFALQRREYLLNLPCRAMTHEEVDEKTDEIEGRIRSRSMGLLEVRITNREKQNMFAPGPSRIQSVEFIHKTVFEFLRAKGIWDEIEQLTTGSGFHPAHSLFRSCVSVCKTRRVEDVLIFDDSIPWRLMDKAFEYAAVAEATECPASVTELEDLDKVMQSHWNSAGKCLFDSDRILPTGHWTTGYTIKRSVSTNQKLLHASKPVCLESLMVYHTLASSLADRLRSASMEQKNLLLLDATRYFLSAECVAQESIETQRRRAKICSDLLDSGASPNSRSDAGDTTCWRMMLDAANQCLDDRTKFHAAFGRKEHAFLFSQLLASFAIRGADMHMTVRGSKHTADAAGARNNTAPAWSIIDRLFSRVPTHGLLDESIVRLESEQDSGEIGEFRRLMMGLVRKPYMTIDESPGSKPQGLKVREDHGAKADEHLDPKAMSARKSGHRWAPRFGSIASKLFKRQKFAKTQGQ